jgi:50S ribosomal subunit-associated GTPase HflX
MGHGRQTCGKMIKELEEEIRDLQKELSQVQKDQAVLRLQPCRGDLIFIALVRKQMKSNYYYKK